MQAENIQALRWGRWEPEELDHIRNNYDGTTLSIKRISKQLGRSENAIQAKIYKLELNRVRKIRQCKWSEEEQEYLSSIAGTDLLKNVTKKLNQWRHKRGQRERTAQSIKRYCHVNGISLAANNSGDLLTKKDIETGLRSGNRTVSRWLKDKTYAAILSPQIIGSDQSCRYLIQRKNLRKLFVKYPGLIDGMNPDMAWFIDLLTNP